MVNTKIRLIIFFSAKDGEALYSHQKKDWELTVAQIMNSLLQNSDLNWRKSVSSDRKKEETTRPFRYDLNQILYDYTVEVTNRLKRLDLIDRVPEELLTDVHDVVQEAVIKTIPKKRNAKSKMAVWGGLTNSCEKKRSERQRRKGKMSIWMLSSKE